MKFNVHSITLMNFAICLTGTVTHTVKPYQKYALVWAGTYKSIADIPDKVS
jgi:hypothetical protein